MDFSFRNMLGEAEHLQKKIGDLLKTMHEGISWTPQCSQELSSLVNQRKRLAEKIGLWVIANHYLDFGPACEVEDDWLWTLTDDLEEMMHQSPDPRMSSLERIVEGIFSWGKQIPKENVILSMECIAASLRCLQILCPNHDTRIKRLFQMMTDFSKTYRPGRVNGLAMAHDPLATHDQPSVAWEMDADRAFNNHKLSTERRK